MKVTHDDLIRYGCKFERREDRSDDAAEIRSGYWLDGTFLGETPRQAAEAIGCDAVMLCEQDGEMR